MTSDTTKAEPLQPSSAPQARLFSDCCDSIEGALRERVRTFVAELIKSELDAVLARARYVRQAKSASGAPGHRHGSRTRTLMGSFGQIALAVPRARLRGPDGKTREWKSQALRAYQCRTVAADSPPASLPNKAASASANSPVEMPLR